MSQLLTAELKKLQILSILAMALDCIPMMVNCPIALVASTSLKIQLDLNSVVATTESNSQRHDTYYLSSSVIIHAEHHKFLTFILSALFGLKKKSGRNNCCVSPRRTAMIATGMRRFKL